MVFIPCSIPWLMSLVVVLSNRSPKCSLMNRSAKWKTSNPNSPLGRNHRMVHSHFYFQTQDSRSMFWTWHYKQSPKCGILYKKKNLVSDLNPTEIYHWTAPFFQAPPKTIYFSSQIFSDCQFTFTLYKDLQDSILQNKPLHYYQGDAPWFKRKVFALGASEMTSRSWHIVFPH